MQAIRQKRILSVCKKAKPAIQRNFQFKKGLCIMWISILGLIDFSKIAYSGSVKKAPPLFIFDQYPDTIYPSKFRTTHFISKSHMNTMSYASMNTAGGSQFNQLQLLNLIKLLGKNTIIVDLRQEQHFFINSWAVSIYSKNNWGDTNKNQKLIKAEEAKQITRIKKLKTVKILQTYQNRINLEKIQKTFILPIQSALTEEQFVRHLGLQYQRFFVPDHKAPPNDVVDEFVAWLKFRSKQAPIYFHCHAGIGRTTTFLVMTDIFYNAKQVAFKDILQRHVAIGGKDLAKMPAPNSYKYHDAQIRYNLIKKFYCYVKMNVDGFQTTWSQFVNQDHHTCNTSSN